MQLTGKEKLYFLLNRIDDKRVLTPSGKLILIHPDGDLNGYFPEAELMLLLTKLQDDLKVIRISRLPNHNIDDWNMSYREYEEDYYGLEILPTFNEYFTKTQRYLLW